MYLGGRKYFISEEEKPVRFFSVLEIWHQNSPLEAVAHGTLQLFFCLRWKNYQKNMKFKSSYSLAAVFLMTLTSVRL